MLNSVVAFIIWKLAWQLYFHQRYQQTLSESVIYDFADCRFKGMWKKMLIKQNKSEPVKSRASASWITQINEGNMHPGFEIY